MICLFPGPFPACDLACAQRVLLGLFWPESDEAHARAALRKGLHMLRRAVGEGVVVTRGEEQVGVDFAAISCDAIAFQDHVERGRLDEAMALYRGDLLPGFFIDEAPEFERWLDRERSRLRGLAARTAQRLTDQLESAGRLAEAVGVARIAAEVAGTDERTLRRLLELLDRVGDRTGAMFAYDEFVRQVASAAGVEPSAETQELVRRIRGRTIPPVVAVATTVVGGAAAPADSAAGSSMREQIDRVAPPTEDQPTRNRTG